MIVYHKSPFGLNLVFRLSGSAVYRASFLGFFSIIYLVLMRQFWKGNSDDVDYQLLHPYTVAVVLAGTSFLLVFRLQAAYGRYWEATSSIHQMMSKWMDSVIHTAAFHMTNHKFDHIKPPSFFVYHDLNALFLTRDREREATLLASPPPSSPNDNDDDDNTENNNKTYRDELRNSTHADQVKRKVNRAVLKSIEQVNSARFRKKTRSSTSSNNGMMSGFDSAGHNIAFPRIDSLGNPLPFPLEGPPRLDGNWGALFEEGKKKKKGTYYDPQNPNAKDPEGFASFRGGQTPSLFLQELAHLTSLMNAVALATLRNDVDGAESPLDIYNPGEPWPEVDPLKSGGFRETKCKNFWETFITFFGFGRTAEKRTAYNARRPLAVIGGVSDAEIRYLQMARGAYAKAQLTFYWLSEFIIREHLAGTLGDVGPPIISRIFQFLSDGMIGYNQARKIMFIPFPFPHAQLSVLFVLIACPVIAFLMDQFTVELWVACVLTFLATTVLAGIHEVARELENPFRNVPNELPLVTMQAQFNEALITMYAGYHPDHFWQEEGDEMLNPESSVYKPSSDAGFSEKTEATNDNTADDNDAVSERKAPQCKGACEHGDGTCPKQQGGDSPCSRKRKMDEQIQHLLAKLEEQAQQLQNQGLELEKLKSMSQPKKEQAK